MYMISLINTIKIQLTITNIKNVIYFLKNKIIRSCNKKIFLLYTFLILRNDQLIENAVMMQTGFKNYCITIE